jgi:hypothetical protein
VRHMYKVGKRYGCNLVRIQVRKRRTRLVDGGSTSGRRYGTVTKTP